MRVRAHPPCQRSPELRAPVSGQEPSRHQTSSTSGGLRGERQAVVSCFTDKHVCIVEVLF
jgi:hypothetical protein